MFRNISEITTQDKLFLKLAEQIKKGISDRKTWKKFVKYMDYLYPKCKTCWDTGKVSKIIDGKKGMFIEVIIKCPNCKK